MDEKWPAAIDDGPKVNNMTGKKPIEKFQAGQVSAALWETDAQVDGRAVTILKASVERRFKDRNGVWQSSTNFARNEIPLAVWCLQGAFDAIVGRQQNNAKAEINQAIEEQRAL